MRVGSIYVRFYRAFNYDYLAKHRGASPQPWDAVDGDLFYPFIRVDLDEAVTCVVGANESGKSQLLTALEQALTGSGIEASDFCRYSSFFGVDAELRTPQFGIEFTDTSQDEQALLREAIGPEAPKSFSTVHLFRAAGDVVAYFDRAKPVTVSDVAALNDVLPSSFRIDPEIPIPNSIPISFLSGRDTVNQTYRRDRWALIDPIVTQSEELLAALGAPEQVTKLVTAALDGASPGTAMSDREREAHNRQLQLGYDLLVTVGGIHPSAFEELERALRREDEGFANGVIAAMNAQLSESLNLAKWWTQDSSFDLQVAARDYDLVFTVRDRTSSEYSFAERSSGLKYFLSYLVQYLAREAEEGCPQLLLMDEPDAFLSNQGQQDLLRLFLDFTREPDRQRQVIFVTHSPFLIDKNRADRIRVLDKGAGDEGTRVVRNVGHNHFEPLRSSLGSFVGETAFIGNCNLMVEGVSDQIYLAGMSGVLRRRSRSLAEVLDLNSLTLVPAGSATHIPYLVYLARGRDTDQPAVVVLLDGDSEGDKARKALARGGAHGKQLLPSDYILQLGQDRLSALESDRPDGPVDIEDLVPIDLGLIAAESYLSQLSANVPAPFPSRQDVEKHLGPKTGVLAAIQKALDAAGADLKLEKVGFARHVVDAASSPSAAVDQFDRAFAALFVQLGEVQRAAERERDQSKIDARVDRLKSAFLDDFRRAPSRAELKLFLEEIEARLDTSLASDRMLVEIRRMREEHVEAGDLGDLVEDFDSVRAQVERLQYVPVLASEADFTAATVGADAAQLDDVDDE